jgi:hypothetical protein
MFCVDSNFEDAVSESKENGKKVCSPDEMVIVKNGYKALLDFSKSKSLCGDKHVVIDKSRFFSYRFWYDTVVIPNLINHF